MAVDPDTLGALAAAAMRGACWCENEWNIKTVMFYLREAWAEIPDYYRRDIFVKAELEAMPKYKRPLQAEWAEFVRDLMPPKAPFTLDYRCCKCKRYGMKLWRGWHGARNKAGHELLCAKCLAPDIQVDSDGMADSGDGHGRSDQIAGWCSAVPVGDTYWGYTSVPTADVNWWKALPTYLEEK